MSDLAEIMKTDIKSILVDQPLIMAARRMRDERIGSLLVKKNDGYVGVLTEADIVRKAAAAGKDLTNRNDDGNVSFCELKIGLIFSRWLKCCRRNSFFGDGLITIEIRSRGGE